jgi:F-type H+-transporting ATPase subunit b
VGIVEAARLECEEMTSRANREIDLARAKALEGVWSQAAEISCEIAGRILERAVTADDHRKLIDDTLTEYRKQAESA